VKIVTCPLPKSAHDSLLWRLIGSTASTGGSRPMRASDGTRSGECARTSDVYTANTYYFAENAV
jgi:hypothetical protein